MTLATPPSRLFFGLLPWYSVLMVCGIVVAILLATKEEHRLQMPKDTVIDACFYLIPLGIIGARIYFVVFEWQQFKDNLIRVFYIWEGGVAIYGALIGGLIGLTVFSRVKKLSLRRLLDMLAPGVVLAQAIGRWGNYFNQEAYGYLVTDPAQQFFPLAVYITNGLKPEWHYATFFYESCIDVAIFVLLTFYKHRKQQDGDVFLVYIMLYAAGRAVIEGMRTDSLMLPGSALRVSQLLSLIIAFTVAIYFIARKIRRKTNA